MRRMVAVAVGLVSTCALCRGAVLHASPGAATAARSAGATQQPAQPAQPVPTQTAGSGGDVAAPKLVKHVNAEYPKDALHAHVTGVVTLEVTVGPDGHVRDARVLSGAPLLNQAAIDAVKQWQFTPAIRNGVAVPANVTAEVSFEQLGRPPAASAGTGAGIGTGTATATATGTGMATPTPLLSDEAARRDPFLLALGRAGVFQVGMSIDTLYHRIARAQTKLVDQETEGHFTPAIEVRLDPAAPGPALFAFYRVLGNEWRVWSLDILDPRFRTTDGLGVGSTLAQIRAISPKVQPDFGEHGPRVWLLDRGLLLWLDASGVVGRTVPDTAVVTRVSIGGGPLPSSPRSAP